jgi:CheY-like chemotaxis protein
MSRVLVIDDSPAIVQFLQAILEAQQYEVVTASDGTDGLAKVHQTRPDVIVTDSLMPGMDGFDFLRALRADHTTEEIPVIMLTSTDLSDPEHANRQPQPNAFVKKSADFGPLLAEIADALRHRRPSSF